MEEDIITSIHRIIGGAENSGIKLIIPDRNSNLFDQELKRNFKESKGKKILMMGTTTVAGFFGRDPVRSRRDLFEEALKNGTKFEIILLDPRGKSAKLNAQLEENKEEEFHQSSTYLNLDKAKKYLNEKQRQYPNQIKVYFVDVLPNMLFIKTKCYTFIEPYTMGSLDVLDTLPDDYEGYRVYGGFEPIFLVENGSTFAKLSESYFNKLKKQVAKNNKIRSSMGVAK